MARPSQIKAPRKGALASYEPSVPELRFALRSTTLRATPRPNNATKILYLARQPPYRSVSSLARQSWRTGLHLKSEGSQELGRRNKSSASKSESDQKSAKDDNRLSTILPEAKKEVPRHQESSPSSNKYLHLSHLPKMPHRPTKEELLAAATGFWSRLKVRFKWFSIRSVRPWNVDDWSAFVSWFVLGNIVWIFIGTTTFFSLVILSINTVVAQGTLLRFNQEDTEANNYCRNFG